MTLFIVSVALALGVSFLCSVMEATLLSLTPSQVAALSSRHPRRGAIWQQFKLRIDRPISVILILNTAAHTIGATVAGAQFKMVFGDNGVALFAVVFTWVMLQFTEILPKTLGVRFNTVIALVAARPMEFLVWMFAPVIAAIRWLNRPFEPKQTAAEQPVTLQEIGALAGLARMSNLLSPQQEQIIHGTSQLANKRAQDVMIPVSEVTFLFTSQTLSEAIVTAHLDPHTRFPIGEGADRDRVLGYVNFKELVARVRTNPTDPSLRGIIRPVHVAVPGDSVADLLKVFVERHEHMAIVRDAQGATLGLITLEDVIEELVGELEDEFDRLPRMIHQLSAGTWMVGGGVSVAELASTLGLTLPDATGSVSGWLMRQLGPKVALNATYRVAATEFMVRRLRRGKIFEVAITRA